MNGIPFPEKALVGAPSSDISTASAEKIEQRMPDLVIRIQPEEEPDEDDPYADYKIPDDLMW